MGVFQLVKNYFALLKEISELVALRDVVTAVLLEISGYHFGVDRLTLLMIKYVNRKRSEGDCHGL